MADVKPTTTTAPEPEAEGTSEISPPPVSTTQKETPFSLPPILTNKETTFSPPSSSTISEPTEQPEKLTEFKQLVQEAITNKDFYFSSNLEEPTSEIKSNHEEISIWGIPLLKDERTDVSDLKNSPGPGKRELRLATKQALQLLQDNYPEFVAKQVFINVPWWYLTFYSMMSPFMTQRTKSKFVFASPARTTEALFKYAKFTIDDPAAVVTVKPTTKQTVEIIINEKCTFVWELRVVGWEVRYSAEYVPNNQSNYTINIQKPKKIAPTDEPVISHSYKINEIGKLLLSIDNPTSKKKMLLYRFKVDPLSE
ncbi:hypothetical protein L1987_10368 [Smallanthus sonchifolius]|uniref:Uncharacterized protein n=1 Tax=Smallanthus sonchifolius TaxID=185202 RepID=A0ACB9JRZ8_9ASTR|nr:hypothetical protein L1987_10368 [Smallanthus sonchifolius]